MVSHRIVPIVPIDSHSLRDLYNSFIYSTDTSVEHSENISDVEIIKKLITLYPNTQSFEFVNLAKYERSRLYKAISQMCLPFLKYRVNNQRVIIFLKMTTASTNNIIRYGTNNNFIINNLNKTNNNNISNNMQKKLKIANIIFDIKDTMTDFMFKELMDTLNEITN